MNKRYHRVVCYFERWQDAQDFLESVARDTPPGFRHVRALVPRSYRSDMSRRTKFLLGSILAFAVCCLIAGVIWR